VRDSSRISGSSNEKMFPHGIGGGAVSAYQCRDNASARRRRRLGRGAHRWTCRRNDYRGRSHRATLLSAATRLCGSRVILLLDARRASMGWLSRRMDLSQHQSLRVGFSLAPSTRRRCFSRISSAIANADESSSLSNIDTMHFARSTPVTSGPLLVSPKKRQRPCFVPTLEG
jgi:hypothetical protein